MRVSHQVFNLKTAAPKILTGHNRQEQEAFKKYRSYYLFESNYATLAQGHEKGGVENGCRLCPTEFHDTTPEANSYEELNAQLWKACQENLHRKVQGQPASVADLLADERSLLLPPGELHPACVSFPVKPNGYSQIELDTNRYSVPAEYGSSQLVLLAYPFRIEVLFEDKAIAVHPRCFEREQDILDPLRNHLGRIEKRPGAFEHAKPMRRWRKSMAAGLHPFAGGIALPLRCEVSGVKEFIAVLKLHKDHPASEVEQAVHDALALGLPARMGLFCAFVKYNMRSLTFQHWKLNGSQNLAAFGSQPVNLQQYDRFGFEVSMERNELLESYLRQLRLPSFVREVTRPSLRMLLRIIWTTPVTSWLWQNNKYTKREQNRLQKNGSKRPVFQCSKKWPILTFLPCRCSTKRRSLIWHAVTICVKKNPSYSSAIQVPGKLTRQFPSAR